MSILQILRGLVHNLPSKQTWAQICDTINNSEEPDLAVAIEYARKHTSSWPIESREYHLYEEFGGFEEWMHETGELAWLHEPPSWWPLVASLSIRSRLEHNDGAQILASSPCLTGLMVLSLHDTWIDEQGLRSLISSPYLDNLIGLDLSMNENLEHQTGRFIASSANLSSLKYLGLDFVKIGNQGLEAILNSPYLGELKHLHLCSSDVDAEGAAVLASSRRLSDLVTLDLSMNEIGTQGLMPLISSPNAQGLKHLELESVGLADEGAKMLASSPHLCNLVHLGVSYNQIGPDGVRALISSPYLSKMVHLDLEGNDVADIEDSRIQLSRSYPADHAYPLLRSWYKKIDEDMQLQIDT